MSLNTTPVDQEARITTSRPAASLRWTTVVVAVVAAAVTTGVAAAMAALGVSFEVQGESIPLAAVAQMTLIATVIGGVLVAVLDRRSTSPHRRFLQVALGLTALSCIPSVITPDDAATKVALVVLHVVAAAIAVPVLARHAHD